jgi:hypothetical protein
LKKFFSGAGYQSLFPADLGGVNRTPKFKQIRFSHEEQVSTDDISSDFPYLRLYYHAMFPFVLSDSGKVVDLQNFPLLCPIIRAVELNAI